MEDGGNARRLVPLSRSLMPIWVALSCCVAAPAHPDKERQKLNGLLVTALQERKLTQVKALLQRGAPPNAKDTDGTPVLVLAIAAMEDSSSEDMAQAAELLLSKGADPNSATRDGVMPLMCIVDGVEMMRVERSLLLERLVKEGARVNAADSNGDTPLLYATWHLNVSGVRALLRAGADTQHKNRSGDTALDVARHTGHYPEDQRAIIRLLQRAGAKQGKTGRH
jgi:uncharacterized protein